MKLQLVDDARHFWKWFSTWLVATNGTFIVAYENFQPLKDHISPSLAHWITVALLGATIAGRVIKQYDTEHPDP